MTGWARKTTSRETNARRRGVGAALAAAVALVVSVAGAAHAAGRAAAPGTNGSRVIVWNPTWFGQTRLSLGVRDLGGDWGHGRRQLFMGLGVDARRKAWRRFRLASDVLVGYEDGRMDGLFGELHAGFRWHFTRRDPWRRDRAHPYVGFGPALGAAKVRDRGRKAFGWGWGGWVQVGWAVPADEKLWVGVEVRYSWIPADMDAIPGLSSRENIGGWHAFGTVAFRW